MLNRTPPSSSHATDLHSQHLLSLLPTVASSQVPWLPVSPTAHAPAPPPGACPCWLPQSTARLCVAPPGGASRRTPGRGVPVPGLQKGAVGGCQTECTRWMVRPWLWQASEVPLWSSGIPLPPSDVSVAFEGARDGVGGWELLLPASLQSWDAAQGGSQPSHPLVSGPFVRESPPGSRLPLFNLRHSACPGALPPGCPFFPSLPL